MAWWNIFSSKRPDVNKDILSKEMHDLESLGSYTKTFQGELVKLKPLLVMLEERARKGKPLAREDIQTLQGFDRVISDSIGKYAKLESEIKADSRFANLRDDGDFKVILQYVGDITAGRNKIVGLSLIHEGYVSESILKLRTAINMIDANIEYLDAIKDSVLRIERSLLPTLKVA
jgi:hypothetical protein